MGDEPVSRMPDPKYARMTDDTIRGLDELGRFADYSDEDLAGQCRFQARSETLDPDYEKFMRAVALRLDALRTLTAQLEEARAENERLKTLINSPETENWIAGVPLEAAHQIERWGADHDAGKTPLDWFWLIGYLSQKAATAAIAGDAEKARHHTISTGAALLNWHRHISGENKSMRPGIDPIERNVA